MARSKRPTGNGIHLDGIRDELRAAVADKVKRGDPRALIAFIEGDLTIRQREEASWRTCQASRSDL